MNKGTLLYERQKGLFDEFKYDVKRLLYSKIFRMNSNLANRMLLIEIIIINLNCVNDKKNADRPWNELISIQRYV